MPRGNYYLEDQLKRALSSAILNLSEGNARRSIKERNRFFDISLASIAETSSALDIINAYGYITAMVNEEIKSQLRLSYAMIMRMRR
jgi:four helix bundle protein